MPHRLCLTVGVNETERAKVGQTLEAVRGALSVFVDEAMTTAFGSEWDDVVANGDAKRRPDGRKQLISKTDLAVMLKVIQFQKIDPWSPAGSYPNPRIRSYASEILTLRNLFAHGDECLNENARLLDTAGRFLELLGVPIPESLGTPDPVPASASDMDRSDVAAGTSSNVNQVFNDVISRLGARGEVIAQLLARAEIVQRVTYRMALESFDAEPGSPEEALIRKDLPGLLSLTLDKPVGKEVLDLLNELRGLDADADQVDSTVLRVLAQFVRCVLLDDPSGVAALSLAFEAIEKTDADAGDQMELVTNSIRRGVENWRHLIELARGIKERSLSDTMIVMGNSAVARDSSTDTEESLVLVRDTSTRLRMFAGMEPGAKYEGWLIACLRFEGRLCNDLDRADEAMRAFARADEIIDRYPAADPDLY